MLKYDRFNNNQFSDNVQSTFSWIEFLHLHKEEDMRGQYKSPLRKLTRERNNWVI